MTRLKTSQMTITNFDPELIRRHDTNGPRYTSYPTADQFREGPWLAAYQRALEETDLRSLSLYMHVPFCATICYYCACNKINTANEKKAGDYVERLIREMELQRALFGSPHTVEQLHFGGGTPTFLTDDQFSRVFDALHTHFNLADDGSQDFSIEIDPRKVGAERIEHLAGLGINRISVGVQDFDPLVQVAVNRVQSVEETRTVIETARANGVKSVNIDLINGLPRQTVYGFAQSLDRVIDLQPDRLSLYSYAHLPHRFKTQRQIDGNELPDASTKLKLLSTAIDMLSEAGYEYVGMDHFAKTTDSLIQAREQGTLHRNFQGYTTHGHCELVSLGVSSIGNVGRIYVQNAKTLHEYYAAIDAGKLAIQRGLEATDDDVATAGVIQDLMCRFEVDFDEFERRTGRNFRSFFSASWPRLRQLEGDGLVEVGERRIRVTDRGRFLVRNVAMAFDAYIASATEKFSKAI